jgi:hypothetical protein
LTFVIVSISLNLNYQIPLIQLDLRHNLSETSLIRDNFNFRIVNFPSICSNIPAASADELFVSQLKRCSGAWILLSFIESVSQMNTHMFGLYWLQVISFVLTPNFSPCVTHNRLLHQQHDECHLWNRTLFTILSFCVQLQF